MNKHFYAVVIGFNKYSDRENLPALEFAENDAAEIAAVLTDPNFGNFPPENIKLITENPTQDEIETTLYTYLVKDRTPEDTVLFYYSGHGFIAGDNQDTFLATPNVTVTQILNNPKAGLSMEYLHSDLFLKSKAKNVIFFLDCCHAGAFCPNFKGDADKEKKLFEEKYITGDGRVAFVSSPKGVVSRESKQYQHGIFTYYLLKGMRGEGVNRHSGQVTIYQLFDYVDAMCPPIQKPIVYGKTGGISLYQPAQQALDESPTFQVYDRSSFLPANLDEKPHASPLFNPIEKQIEYMDILMRELLKVEHSQDVILGNQVLSAIRRSLDSEFAFFLRVDANQKIVSKFESDFDLYGIEKEDYKRYVLNDIYPMLVSPKNEILPMRYGFYRSFQSIKNSGLSLLVIPIQLEYPREFLILSGVKPPQLEFGEVLGHTLISLFKVTNDLANLEIPKIETGLIDDTKRDFGQVPYAIYARRFSQFRDRLSMVSFVYEPIVYLGGHDIEIDSWEALARDPGNLNQAPVDLFQAAELWGPEFITELDLYCLRKAITEYNALWKQERPGEKVDQLSINVYPETLFRTAYKKAVESIVKHEGLLKGKRLVLELSEKRPLPRADRMEDGSEEQDPIAQFVDKIHEYTREFGIGFAIDDFGVGHSSSARLAKLQLDHVKIDRDVLHHQYPDCTIRYVLDLVQRSHMNPSRIVMEGFDGLSHIPLKNLYELGIEYVQGHLIRRGIASVSNLDPEKKEYLQKLL